jgi:molybdopterin molybdotransferase
MSVAEALQRVLADAHPLAPEAVALDAALGRVLTEDLNALRTQPPAAVSAMDGYAVRAADVAQAPVKPPASLPAASCRPAPTP